MIAQLVSLPIKIKEIILLRKESRHDLYREALEASAYITRFIPVLETTFVNADQLKATLESSTQSGIIISSQAVSEGVRNSNASLKGWKEKPIYCVGPATSRTVKELGLQPYGACSGSALRLAEYIVANHSSGPLLYLTGDKTRSSIFNSLSEHNIQTDLLQVYQTRSLTITENLDGHIIVLFSPSGLQSFSSLPIGATWISIGPTTTMELASRDIKCVQADHPTPSGILRALSQI